MGALGSQVPPGSAVGSVQVGTGVGASGGWRRGAFAPPRPQRNGLGLPFSAPITRRSWYAAVRMA